MYVGKIIWLNISHALLLLSIFPKISRCLNQHFDLWKGGKYAAK